MAGKLAQNAILKNVGSAQNRQKYAGLSYTEGINVRSVAGDFALGAGSWPCWGFGRRSSSASRWERRPIRRRSSRTPAWFGWQKRTEYNQGTRTAVLSRNIRATAEALPQQTFKARVATQLKTAKSLQLTTVGRNQKKT